jgi:hypothetical protein
MSVEGYSEHIEMINTYAPTPHGWKLPSIAMGSECWALIRMPMHEAIRIQTAQNSALKVKVQATDANGNQSLFEGTLEKLPIIPPEKYDSELAHELVERRINELLAAQLQLQIREAALERNWPKVEELLSKLESIGRNEPWVAASIKFTRQLIEDRDERRMSKEMLYKSRKMNHRLSSTDEIMFSVQSDSEMPAFLRRKSTEGRRSGL